jgi:hypothetical protein
MTHVSGITRSALLYGWILLTPTIAAADSPPVPPRTLTCSLANRACAALSPDHRSAIIWRKGARGTRTGLWTAHIVSPYLAVEDSGDAMVELYPGLTLLSMEAGPETIVLVFHRRGAVPVRIRLSDVIKYPSRLPKTVSHRHWANAMGFNGRGSFVLDTVEGRYIRFDPATGREQPDVQPPPRH